MKHIKITIVIVLALALVSIATAGCASESATNQVSFVTTADGRYKGFDKIPTDYTPEQAAADGCMVITISDSTDSLYAGQNVFRDFLERCKLGDAFMRIAQFSDENVSFDDLIYKDGKYCLVNSEHPADVTFYSKLRKLTTASGDGDQPNEVILYVLTDSDELTADDVLWSYLSSVSSTVTDIPFTLLAFTVYLDELP